MISLLRWLGCCFTGCLLGGCAVLGTKARINKGVPPSAIASMGFVIEDLGAGKSGYRHRVDSLFVESLMQELTQISGRDVYFLGRLTNPRITTERLDSISRRYPQHDVLAFCDLRLQASDTLPGGLYSNASVRLLLVMNPEKDLLAKTSFNTRLGRSYWLNPKLPQAVRDAVHGACRPLERYFQRGQPPTLRPELPWR